jgi:hypothetical protein
MASLAKTEYPFVSWVMEGVADFITRQRRRMASWREFDALTPAEVSSIARDLKLSKSSLRELAAQDQQPLPLVRMLAALHKIMPPAGDLLARDMQATCSLCHSKKRCNRELASRTAAANYREFCPNAFNLDLLARNDASFGSGYRAPVAYHI